MIYGLFIKFDSTDIGLNGSAKNSPHLYEKLQGVEGVFERRLYSLFTNEAGAIHLSPHLYP